MKRLVISLGIIFGFSIYGCGPLSELPLNEGAQQIPYVQNDGSGETPLPDSGQGSLTGAQNKRGKLQISNTQELAKLGFGFDVDPASAVADISYTTNGSQVIAGEFVIYAMKGDGKWYGYKFSQPSGYINGNQLQITYRDSQGSLDVVGSIDSSGRISANISLDCAIAQCTTMGGFSAI